MKKVILMILLVTMLSTPCLAEVEPNIGFYFLEGTLWEVSLLPSLDEGLYLGFSMGKVYFCSDNPCNDWSENTFNAFYIDLFAEELPSFFYSFYFYGNLTYGLGWAIPILEIGGMIVHDSYDPSSQYNGNFIMTKIDDIWKPSD